MATFICSKQDILQKYRDSVHDNRNHLINCLRTGSWKVPLVNAGCLTEGEWATIEEKSGSGRCKRTERATAILDLIIKKDSFSCYSSFSRVVVDKNRPIGNQFFPFIKELEEAGLHRPLVAQKQVTKSTKTVNAVIILWLLTSESECDKVTKEMKLKSSSTTERFGYHCQEFSISEGSATLFLAYPKTSYNGSNPFTSLLNALHPRLAIMTGTCQPVRGNSPLTPGHVVMVTTREPLSITGEVGFMCELWKLNDITTLPLVSGRATKWADDDSCLVQCRDAVDFYNAAGKVDNLEYFAVLQVEDQKSHMTTSSRIPDSLMQLMCEIVHYFSNDRI